MNSRERVLTSICHKEPDRVPIDLGGTPVSGISAIAYYNLKQHLRINSGTIRVYDLMQQLAIPEQNVLDLFKVDVLDIGRTFNTQDEDWYDIHVNGYDLQYPNWFRPIHNPDDSYDILHSDGTIIARMTKDALVFDQTYYPCKDNYPTNYSEFQKMINQNPWAAVTTPPFSNIGQKKFWKTLRQNAITLKEQSNRLIALNLGSTSFEFANSFRRLDRFLIDLVRNRSKVEKFLDFLLEFFLNSLGVICGYVGDIIDVIKIGDDLGENKGPFISPKLFREIFKPRINEIC
ncbi:MAG: methyltransferase, partial [Candidatus Thorarchaeota archaeon]